MKKIAVITASGKAGSLIAQKAFGRGHEVTAIVRNKARLKVEVTTILENIDSRLIVVGGASSLYLDESHEKLLLDVTPTDLPYFPTLLEMAKASLIYEASKLNVTFFSPAEFFDPEGAQTNNYTITGDVLEHNKAGKSRISYADYAEAVLNMIEDGSHQHEHIGIYEN